MENVIKSASDLFDDEDAIDNPGQEQLEPESTNVDNSEQEGSENQTEETDITEVLSYYGITDGKIEYGDELVDYNSLPAEDKAYVLEQLLASKAADNNSNEYDEDELSLLQEIRNSGLTPSEYLEQFNNTTQEITRESDFETYTPDDVFKYDYLLSLPDDEIEQYSDEELEALLDSELSKAKESSTFDKRMNTLKSKYVNEQKLSREQELKAISYKEQQELEREKENFVVNTHSIKNIGNYALSDEHKNFVYGKFLELDEQGQSPFFKEILSNPELAFKAVYYAYFGDSQIENLVKHYSNEIKKAREQGKTEVAKGYPTKRTIIPSDIQQPNKPEDKKIKPASQLFDEHS